MGLFLLLFFSSSLLFSLFFSEIKQFNNPPEMVAVVIEAICLLLHHKTDWKSAKAKLGEMDFMDQLKKYDKDNIDPKIIKKCVTLSLSFTHESLLLLPLLLL